MKKNRVVLASIIMAALAIITLVWMLRSTHGLTVSIASSKTTHHYGEEVVFKVSLSNNAKEELVLLEPELWYSPKDSRNTAEFEIRDENRALLGRKSHTLAGKIFNLPKLLVLQPEETATFDVPLFTATWELRAFPERISSRPGFSYVYSDGSLDSFLKPGEYRVRLRYQNVDGERIREWIQANSDMAKEALLSSENETERKGLQKQIDHWSLSKDLWEGTVTSNETRVKIVPKEE